MVLFSTYTISAVGIGLLFNHVPTQYLFILSTLSHILGYLVYALATNGWMMILARGLAGVQLGATSLVFAYCSVSFEKYTENMKILGKYEKKEGEKVKGYVFSLFIVGNSLGFAIGIGKCDHAQKLVGHFPPSAIPCPILPGSVLHTSIIYITALTL